MMYDAMKWKGGEAGARQTQTRVRNGVDAVTFGRAQRDAKDRYKQSVAQAEECAQCSEIKNRRENGRNRAPTSVRNSLWKVAGCLVDVIRGAQHTSKTQHN